jgi:transcriptional regulator with XRE-family HTH domain/quercetin dioxygenase-like cupin family protein
LIVVASSAVPPIGARLRAERRRRDVSVRGLAREIGVSASLISQIETEKSSPSVSTLYAITTALGISIEDLFGDPPVDDGSLADDAALDDAALDDAALDEAVVDDAVVVEAQGERVPALAAVGEPAAGPAVTSLRVGEAGLGATLAAVMGATLDPAGLGGTAPGAAPGTDGSAAAGLAAGPAAPGQRLGPVVTPDNRERLTLDSGVTWELLGRIPHKHVDFLLITYEPGGTSSSSGLLMRHSGTEFGFVVSGELTLTLGFDTHRLRAGDAVSFDSSTPHAYRNETAEPAVGVWFVLERSA